MKINDINNQFNTEEYVRKVTQIENPQISNQGMFLKKEKEKRTIPPTKGKSTSFHEQLTEKMQELGIPNEEIEQVLRKKR